MLTTAAGRRVSAVVAVANAGFVVRVGVAHGGAAADATAAAAALDRRAHFRHVRMVAQLLVHVGHQPKKMFAGLGGFGDVVAAESSSSGRSRASGSGGDLASFVKIKERQQQSPTRPHPSCLGFVSLLGNLPAFSQMQFQFRQCLEQRSVSRAVEEIVPTQVEM